MEEFDAIVIGGGAAGLMCAGVAGGGGRCNFTNREVRPERFLSDNPHFAKSALARYTAADFLALVERHRIPWYEKTLGQLFCEGVGSARLIVGMLTDECVRGGVVIGMGAHVRDVRRTDRFIVDTARGVVTAPALVLATGGLSIPKMGATDFAYRIAAQFGLPLTEIAPALVPLTFGEEDLAWMQPLSGVSLEVAATAGRATFREGALFTHRGLSGPAILQASSYWRAGETLTLDLAPGEDVAAFLLERKRSRPKALVKTVLAEGLPTRLADALAARHGADRPIADMRDVALADLARAISALALRPVGDEGFAKAEVTRGGVDTRALSSQTMEARDVPGLFVIGEAVDVTGWLGGYNFQWAWSSGWCAGQAL
ncbi:MAG: putative flavoprotein [Alphaproteobacteria bacterium]|nr:MAG: putative flavoprotein [Alphaproteobacteria bacterium]